MKFIAMYLPQFHNCPLNSKWWGEGFTEWNNVRTARPLYRGHRQPRIPQDGYYSLDNPETIQAQASQAKEYGIDGFAIYHYWYEGVRPLSKPLDIILAHKDLDLKFSLCWANHSWTRSWKNRIGSLDVLIEQTYETDDNVRSLHENLLCMAFADQRYIRVKGKPLLQIYMPESVPNLQRYIERLRIAALRQLNTEIHVSAMLTAWRPNWSYLNDMDSVTLFQPSLSLFSPVNLFASDAVGLSVSGLSTRLRASPMWLKRFIYFIQDRIPESYKIFNYDDTWGRLIQQYQHCYTSLNKTVFPMAFVNFDNTPRYRSRARIFRGYSDERFKKNLARLADLAIQQDSNGILFLNAWNEWGEGMYLEPDTHSGFARLAAVRDVKHNKVHNH
jgi:hypothetical protein